MISVLFILFTLYVCIKLKTIPFGMAMNVDKSKIYSEPVEIFVAARTSETTAVTAPSLAEVNAGGSATWKCLGGYEGGQVKVAGEPFSLELMDGISKQLGIGMTIEIPLAQSDYTNLQLAESFLDSYVDVILRVVGSSKGYRYKRMGLTVGWQGNHDRKKANVIPVKIACNHGKVTDIMDILTLS